MITVFKILFASALIYWLVQKGVLSTEKLRLVSSPLLVSTSLFLVLAQLLLNNWRWSVLLRSQGLAATARKVFPLTMIGVFFNYVMPGGVGGDVIKGYYLLHDFPEHRAEGVASILMDRILGFFMMIFTGVFAILLNWNIVFSSAALTRLAVFVSLFFLCFFLVLFLALTPWFLNLTLVEKAFKVMPLGAKFRKLFHNIHAYHRSPVALLQACGLSLVAQCLMVLNVFMIGNTLLPGQVPVIAYFFVVPLATVVTALPIAPAGVGVGQTAFLFLFHLYSENAGEIGPVAATALQVFSFVWGLAGAFFYLRRNSSKKPLQVN